MEEIRTDSESEGQRIDSWLSRNLPAHSRSRWQQLIRGEYVKVDGQTCKVNYHLKGNDLITWEEPPPSPTEAQPEDIPLDILFEDDAIIAINKPAGLVVHPAAGHTSGTLVNALLHHCNDLKGIGGEHRPGIVHRLDKDTSGVMVIAKTEQSMRRLVAQFKARETEKTYHTIVWGCPRPGSGTVRDPIGRNPRNRKKMAVSPNHGRHAITHYTVQDSQHDMALLRVRIETGRTHQIRVHMAHIHHPVVGDRLYGGHRPQQEPWEIERQMLHAFQLCLRHPLHHAPLTLEAPWPADFTRLAHWLRDS